MFEQFSCYIIPILACICFINFILAGKRTPMEKLMKYFLAGTFIILAVIVSEVIEQLYAAPNYTQQNWQRWVFSILAYMLRPAIAYVLLLVSVRDNEKKIRLSLIMAIPLVINAIFLLISPFCGIVFSFSETNNYNGGPLKYLPIIVGGLYLIGFLFFIGKKSKKNSDMEWNVSIPVIIMCFTAVYLESRCNLLGSLPMVCTISMIFYYIFFYVEYQMKDPLTGAYQRNRFYKDIKHDGFKYFIIFDINGLKRINDERGHIAGDIALENFGNSIQAILPKKAKFYRIGGDEFVILYQKAAEVELKKLMDDVQTAVKKKYLPYGFSYGFSEFEKAEQFDNAYKEADKMLYKNKDAFWQNYRKNAAVSD